MCETGGSEEAICENAATLPILVPSLLPFKTAGSWERVVHIELARLKGRVRAARFRGNIRNRLPSDERMGRLVTGRESNDAVLTRLPQKIT